MRGLLSQPIFWVLLISLSLCSAGGAQQEIPGDISSPALNQAVPLPFPSNDFTEPRREPIIWVHRHTPKMFWIRWGAVLALTVASSELTASCTHSVPRCGEGNPLFGAEPGRARLYSVKLGLLAYPFITDYRQAHKGGKDYQWDWKYESFLLLPVLAADTAFDAYRIATRPQPNPSLLVNHGAALQFRRPSAGIFEKETKNSLEEQSQN